MDFKKDAMKEFSLKELIPSHITYTEPTIEQLTEFKNAVKGSMIYKIQGVFLMYHLFREKNTVDGIFGVLTILSNDSWRMPDMIDVPFWKIGVLNINKGTAYWVDDNVLHSSREGAKKAFTKQWLSIDEAERNIITTYRENELLFAFQLLDLNINNIKNGKDNNDRV